jgi:hypothetical protein
MPTYIEITKSEHAHGGKGWEFGTCLWSPTKNRAGNDRYSLMRSPEPRDRVIHVYHTEHGGSLDTFIMGESRVARKVRVVDEEPPSPGDWAGMDNYYRIELTAYRQYTAPLPIRHFLEEYSGEILADLLQTRPRFFPFNTHGDGIRTVQGIYLARATETLTLLIDQALGIESANELSQDKSDHHEYTESRRASRERYFFARNPKLAREAKERAAYRCEVCGFHFVELYGDIGRDFLEAHHLDPLADRPELEWSNEVRTLLERVAAVCSNCHRMLHRRRPAYTLEELRVVIDAGRALSGR